MCTEREVSEKRWSPSTEKADLLVQSFLWKKVSWRSMWRKQRLELTQPRAEHQSASFPCSQAAHWESSAMLFPFQLRQRKLARPSPHPVARCLQEKMPCRCIKVAIMSLMSDFSQNLIASLRWALLKQSLQKAVLTAPYLSLGCMIFKTRVLSEIGWDLPGGMHQLFLTLRSRKYRLPIPKRAHLRSDDCSEWAAASSCSKPLHLLHSKLPLWKKGLVCSTSLQCSHNTVFANLIKFPCHSYTWVSNFLHGHRVLFKLQAKWLI